AVGGLEVTAAPVPGSAFKGRGTTHTDPPALLRGAHTALHEVVGGRHLTIEEVDAGSFTRPVDQEIAKNTYAVHLADGAVITIRVSVAPLEGQTVARTVMNPNKQGISPVKRGGAEPHAAVTTNVDVHGRYVIQLSEHMDPVNVRRAVAHEVAEL